jgi:hypothetical protein
MKRLLMRAVSVKEIYVREKTKMKTIYRYDKFMCNIAVWNISGMSTQLLRTSRKIQYLLSYYNTYTECSA